MSIRRTVAIALMFIFGSGVLWGAFAWDRHRTEANARQVFTILEHNNPSELAEAIRVFENASGFEPHVSLLRAASLEQAGDPAGALNELGSVRAEGELRKPALLLTGKCLYRLGRLAEAERVLGELAIESPDDADAHRWLARIYRDLGAMTTAMQELQAVARLEPDEFLCHRLMGMIQSQDLDEHLPAIEHYRNALARRPPDNQRRAILRELSQSLIRQRKFSEALTALDEAGETAEVLALKGECCWILGRRHEAQALLRRALALDSDLRRALLLEARIEMDERRPEGAVPALKRALQQDPHDFEARYQLAMAYALQGESSAAQAEMSRMHATKQLREQLTVLYWDAARQPDNAEVRDRIADLCRRLGKDQLAAIWKRAATECRRIQQFDQVGRQ